MTNTSGVISSARKKIRRKLDEKGIATEWRIVWEQRQNIVVVQYEFWTMKQILAAG